MRPGNTPSGQENPAKLATTRSNLFKPSQISQEPVKPSKAYENQVKIHENLVKPSKTQ